MYVQNQTINIDESVSKSWLKWVEESYIPATIEKTDCVKICLFKVLIQEEMGGITYSLQYFAETQEKLRSFYEKNRVFFLQEMNARFPNKFVTFETELQLLNEVKK